MTIRCNKIDKINEGIERHNFGVFDAKGRAVGSVVCFERGTLVESESQKLGTCCDAIAAPGAYFAWLGMATRGGDPFGASQDWRYCQTENERVKAVRKYLADAEKRAARQFCAGV